MRLLTSSNSDYTQLWNVPANSSVVDRVWKKREKKREKGNMGSCAPGSPGLSPESDLKSLGFHSLEIQF